MNLSIMSDNVASCSNVMECASLQAKEDTSTTIAEDEASSFDDSSITVDIEHSIGTSKLCFKSKKSEILSITCTMANHSIYSLRTHTVSYPRQ